VGHLGGLVVKVPEGRASELVGEGVAQRMVMRDRPMREWLTVDVAAGAQQWDDLVGEAFRYLDEITPERADAGRASSGSAG